MNLRKANYLGSAVLAATTLVVAACGSDGRGPAAPPPAANTAPVMSVVADRSVDQDTSVGPIELGIADRESAAGTLTLTASADSAGVFPADGLLLDGSGTTRTLTLTPLESATGTTAITLTLTDPDGASVARTFNVTVNARAASMRSAALTTFAKTETDDATAVNGYTFSQDADDPAIFEPLIGAE
jgi:predicted small lipoprotein YifL